jgi:hypothetical protein
MSIALLIVLLATPLAPPADERGSVQAHGEQDKTCRQWTDGCVICMRTEAGPPNCSLPGIACQPRDVTCDDPKPPR